MIEEFVTMKFLGAVGFPVAVGIILLWDKIMYHKKIRKQNNNIIKMLTEIKCAVCGIPMEGEVY